MIHALDRLTIRQMGYTRLRTGLSALVVALSVAMLVATEGLGNAIRSAIAGGEQGQSIASFAIGTIDTMFLMINIVMVLAGGFLIFNAFMMSVTQRQRQIGMLRSIGMTRRQIMRMVLLEGLVIGVIGVGVGLAAGPLMAKGLISLLEQVGRGMFTAIGEVRVSVFKMLSSAGIGLGVTLFSALYPAWRATRISPLVAIQKQSGAEHPYMPGRRPRIAAVVVVVLAAYLLIVPPGRWVNTPQDIQLTLLFIGIWLACLVALVPVVIHHTGRILRAVLSQRWKATGRLIADNVRRERQRVTLTALTVAVGAMMIISLSGITQFVFHTLVLDQLEKNTKQTVYLIMPFDMNAGMAAFADDTLQIEPQVIDDVTRATEGLAGVGILRIAFIRDLASPLFPDIYTYVVDPETLAQTGHILFHFTEGSLETALPLMQAGCGVLIVPGLAAKHHVGLGETLTVQGKDGPVDCVVAGIGQSSGPSTLLSAAASDRFEVGPPLMMILAVHPGADEAAVGAIMDDIQERYPKLTFQTFEQVIGTMREMTDGLVVAMNGVLLIAILVAAFGVINTTMMSVYERQREIGLLRAIGATGRQTQGVVIGEAAVIGIVGGAVGVVAGVGMTIICVVTFGGNSIGVTDLPLWSAAINTLRPITLTIVFSLLVTPVISAGAAWISTRGIVQGAVIPTLYVDR